MSGWKIVGITDECTTCEICGKVELKRTVCIETEDGERVWAGTSCAARKVGAPAAKVRGAATSYLRRREVAECNFPAYFRMKFGMSIREMITEHGPDARKGVELVRAQYMRKNGF